jgi:hypothetical protein
VLAIVVLLTAARMLRSLDEEPGHGAEPVDSELAAAAVTLGYA